MARRMKGSTIAIVVIGGVAAIVAVDHYVLKGKLGIAGHVNMLIGQLKKLIGQGAGPIIPTSGKAIGGGLPSGAEQFEGSAEEEALLQQEAELAAEEPETANWAYRY